MSEERRDYNVANGLRDVATLIGKHQEAPVVLGNGEEVVPGLGLTLPAERLLARVDWLGQGFLRLTIVGAVSRGKSTLINAFLGESRLSVDIEACTGVITEIVPGSNVDEVTLVEDGKSRILGGEDFLNTVRFTPEEQVSIRRRETFAMPERLAQIDYAVVEATYPLGEKGLYIVDTPGLRAGRKAEETTKEFLANTDALVFVIRAQPMFEEVDQEFLETQLRLNESRVEHIFFAINDFSRLDEGEREQVMSNARHRLRDYFLTSEGNFDEELFERRVFIVNARDALRARMNEEASDVLEVTGLPVLERSIQQVLEGEGVPTMMLEAATVQVLIPALDEASRSIHTGKAMLSRNLSELERTHREMENQLYQLTGRAHHIRDTFNAYTQRIGERAADHFEDYAIRMMDAWNDDWESLNIGEVIRIWNVAAATVSAEKKEGLTQEISGRIGNYLAHKMSLWTGEVLEHLESDMEEMSTVLEAEVQDFVVKLDEVQASIAGHQMPELLDMQERRVSKTLQILFGVWAFDPNQITGSLMGGSWKGFFLRIVSDAVAVVIALITASFFAGPVGLVVFLSVMLVEMLLVHSFGRRSMLNRVRDRIGRELRTKLVDAAPDIKSEIQQAIGSQFVERSDSLLSALQSEIDQVTSQLNSMLATKQAGEEAVAAERSRLDAIEGHLDGLFKQVSHEVYGRDLTDEEVERLRQGNALLSEDA